MHRALVGPLARHDNPDFQSPARLRACAGTVLAQQGAVPAQFLSVLVHGARQRDAADDREADARDEHHLDDHLPLTLAPAPATGARPPPVSSEHQQNPHRNETREKMASTLRPSL
jgi:hypothetical protein